MGGPAADGADGDRSACPGRQSRINYAPLRTVYGAPLRLRVENQLGYKMVKWISAIEFIASEKAVGAGYGGIKEDEEYFDLIADI